ncbi:MAG: sugar phosphate nucleotidyltransferase, partial [Candidatus Margulisiibacteriota bacterium]
DYFKDGSSFGVKLDYIEAKQDFGTAGAVKLAQDSLEDDFLVLSADVICDFDLSSIIKFHKAKNAEATIALTMVKNPLQYGIVITDGNGKITNFLEKPSWAEVFSDTVNTGIYVLKKEALEAVPANKFFDFSSDLFPLFLKEGKNICGCVCKGYWKDIGNLLEYKNAHADILKGNSLVGEGSFVAGEAVVSNSFVGKRCNIGKGTRIIDSVVWDDVDIGKECVLKGAVIASACVLKERIALEEGCVLGSGCTVYPDTRLLPFIKVWPNKKISEGSTVNRNMIWREKWSNAIFGAYGVTGQCNIEITPEFAAKLGSAYGAMLGKGSAVVSSMDGHKSSSMIYRALIAGILSSGVNVSNIEIVPIPINRYVLKSLSSKGGVHVRKSPFDNEVIDIKFFDGDGMDLPGTKEKSIERLFWGEDYLRTGIEDTGVLSFPFYRVAEEYREGVMHFIDTASVKKRGFKIVLDYAFGSAAQIFSAILGDLACETVAINANMVENKLTKSKEDFDRYLNQLSQIVVTLKADLGVMFDSGAEKLFLVDEEGKILDGEDALAFVSSLVLMTDRPAKIAAPVNTSSVVDILAGRLGSQVIRTKTSFRYMMETASKDGVGFFGEPLGGYIFPAFQPYFDAMMATAKILEMLARSSKTASQIISAIPSTFLYNQKRYPPTRLFFLRSVW